MNYRHAFHAGNHADVVKHVALIACLEQLKRKHAPFAVLDTHAGPGRYDLCGEEAARSPEWRDGIGKLWGWREAPAPLRAYLDAEGDDGAELRFYLGSPLLIAAALRPQDRCIACELHEEDHAALRSAARSARIEIHHRDGYEALAALLPFAARRGLVLIDPPYEAPDELRTAALAIKTALARFGHGHYLWWRPLKRESDLAIVDAEIGRTALRADFWIEAPRADGKLTGSSLLAVNPPFGLEAALRVALPALAARLGPASAGWRVQPR
jgi:23S rRNA (adenine2030-N6)-methyltransferase